MINSTLKSECDLQFFHNHGYIRKKCKSCKAYFWTLDKEIDLCGDQPCVKFNFINNPFTKKSLSLNQVRNHFLTFFENNNHSRVSYPETGYRCPVIARWRSDIYLTIASIADFQPHVTSGDVPPPENPLVISQPCIRLNDLEEVGKSGRHLTIFEMMGHHAFNKNKDEIYWKEETVSYCDEFFKKRIGISREKINYKEQLWIGGGNAGPCLEVIAGGLEIATLVFMNMKEDSNGEIAIQGKKYTPNPLNIVDTGYGLERISWITKGTPTIYESVFPDIINYILDITKKKFDMSLIYALADHSKCLAFMLGDGIVPSNVKAGYLTRLIIRRSLRFIEKLNLTLSLKELVNKQLALLSKEFPSLQQRSNQINEILDIETTKFFDTLSKGKGLVKRIIRDKKTIDKNELIALYDTHGMPPDIVKNIAKKEGIVITIPKNFDSMIAELHSHEEKEEKEAQVNTTLPPSEPLYYEDHYVQEFDAKVVWKKRINGETKIILDKTTFYPDGGGQPGDIGILSTQNKQVPVSLVEKKNNSIIHTIDGNLELGEEVHGKIDWNYRYSIMKHHTGTHVVNGALRTLFGEHIWQAGSQLSAHEARFDFSHYKSITEDEIKKIETVANAFIKKEIPVEKKVMTRNSAEQKYGFRLYQGGVPPGNEIRVLNIPSVDVEACGGTHLNNIKEIEKIRILKTERIQDGVNRILFAAGAIADKYQKEEYEYYKKVIKDLGFIYEIKDHNNIAEQLREASKILSVSTNQLDKTIRRFLKETGKLQKITVVNLPDACNHLFKEWKKKQKAKKKISLDEIEILKKKAEKIPGTNVKIITASSSTDSTVIAGKLIQEPGYIVHIFDGNKITSAASGDVAIDLRIIAPQIGKILGGSGGGKPTLTQSGGPNRHKINYALEVAKKLTKENIKK
jgi:alanyl-tRNA synthetase